MLKLTIIGNLGRDAEIKEIGERMVITFPVAHNDQYTNKDGVKVERTIWVRCDYWREKGNTAVAAYLKKGTQVYVEGAPSVSTYQTREGGHAASLDLRVQTLRLLGGSIHKESPPNENVKDGPDGPAVSPVETAISPDGDEDMPF